MDEPNSSLPEHPAPPPPSRTPASPAAKVFIGPNGLRAGWRLLVFLVIVFGLFAALAAASRLLLHHRALQQMTLTPEAVLAGEGISFVLVLLASWIMAGFEDRTFADYGLPWSRAFSGKFWQGAIVGFAGISALLATMRLVHVFNFGSLALHGAAIPKYAIVWGVAFLCVALFEEFAFRGYSLFTLTTGAGFWPAALICSIVFGYIHRGNPGETWVGTFNAALVGLLFCLMLRRTGDLWMPIGFHAAWDWGESYFYGVPDSGQLVPGHLLNASFYGPRWLSGGSVGPEGSWLCTLLLVILWFAFLALLPQARYPTPEALAPRRRGWLAARSPMPS